jgi:CRISPR/Cas system CSM-associated protein Csm4 (group 5 of RAMP superfamily)
MFALIEIIKSFFTGLIKTQQNSDEEFLAESTDRYDLERRMRLLANDGLADARHYGSWHLDALR